MWENEKFAILPLSHFAAVADDCDPALIGLTIALGVSVMAIIIETLVILDCWGKHRKKLSNSPRESEPEPKPEREPETPAGDNADL